MNNKKLKSNTIIPDKLYVLRSADKQLKFIIEDMGRPGYVLVARQMGKTNLLLHARRTYMQKGDVFAYLDVSNNYPSLESFFRNIIDVILESSDVASEVARLIAAQRAERKLLPHKEHEIELRTILRNIKGKLVICLDEIDALTKTTYSDQIFSLIRSIYFSGRANFEEFSRLTYILSGVAEPADIIKNKEISPFNIGEKIYLEDFSKEEFREFLEKTELNFEQKISDAIYNWTNGNPRITWDLCSAVEDKILETESISVEDISSIVKKLYLTSFDLPPIDHIRSLVEDDKDVRASLMSIHYGKSESIADPIKNKLYLAGICKFDTSSRKIFIKNRIIEVALSEDWVRQVERQSTSIGDLAKKYFDDANYEEAAQAYLELIAQLSDNQAKQFPYYRLGLCYYRKGDYSDAISYLSIDPLKQNQYPKIFTETLFIKGLCNFQLGMYFEAKELFEKALDAIIKDDSPYEHYEVLTSLASAMFNLSPDNSAKAVELYSQTIECAEQFIQAENENKSLWSTLLGLTRHNLAEVLFSLGEIDSAKSELRLALDIGAVEAMPKRLIRLLHMERDKDSQGSILREIVDCVTLNKLLVKPSIGHLQDFNINVCATILVDLMRFGDLKNCELLLRFLIEELHTHTIDMNEFVEKITFCFIEIGAVDQAKFWLQNLLLKLDGSKDKLYVRKFILGCLLVLMREKRDEFENDYLDILGQLNYIITSYDTAPIFLITYRLVKEENFEGSSKLYSIISSIEEQDLELSKDVNLIFEYLKVILLLYLRPDQESFSLASLFLSKAINQKVSTVPFFPSNVANTFMSDIGIRLREIVRPLQNVRSKRKFGRNELISVRLKDGKILKGKYKALVKYLDEDGNKLLDE